MRSSSHSDNVERLIQDAVAYHKQGEMARAEILYMQILDAEPSNGAALQLLGVLRTQQGHHDEAIRLIRSTLERDPANPGALCNLSTALRGGGQLEEALKCCRKAVALQPKFVEAWFNCGVLLSDLRRYAQALECFDRTLKLQPGNSQAAHGRAMALLDLDRAGEALACLDTLLQTKPADSKSLASRGVALAKLRRFGEALESYDQAVADMPGDAVLFFNRGVALVELSRFSDAFESYDQAIALQPDFAEAWFNRGLTLSELGSDQAVLDSVDRALAIRPRYPAALLYRGFLLWKTARFSEALASYDLALQIEESDAAWNGRGAALRMLQRIDEALTSFDNAILLNPQNAQAFSNRADLLWREKFLLESAIRDLESAVAADPDHPYAIGELLHLRMYAADWHKLPEQMAAIETGVRCGRKVARPFVYQAIAELPSQAMHCSSTFAADQYPGATAPTRYEARHHDRIRIGYVSGEFSEQATAYLLAGLYECHDRERFEIIAIDNGAHDSSPMRRRLEAAFDRFVPIAALSDEAAAQKVRDEEIDILINLNGYFNAHRTGLFARKPAPVQVNYLGFPATLGATYMDYIIADRVVLPEDERQFYTEKVVYLPECYQANDARRTIGPSTDTRADHDLPQDAFVFCSFNQSYKLLPAMFAAWMRILKATPDSVLWLLDSQTPFQENLKREAARHGVQGERLIFARHLPLAKHLARLRHAELFLDTLPYNAHTTASDALWAGVPLVTCRGTTFPGRVAASLLQAVGLSDMVLENLADYEARAITLASDRIALEAVRARLMGNRSTYPLFNTELFRRRIEDAYLEMWRIRQAGGSPKSFSITH